MMSDTLFGRIIAFGPATAALGIEVSALIGAGLGFETVVSPLGGVWLIVASLVWLFFLAFCRSIARGKESCDCPDCRTRRALEEMYRSGECKEELDELARRFSEIHKAYRADYNKEQ